MSTRGSLAKNWVNYFLLSNHLLLMLDVDFSMVDSFSLRRFVADLYYYSSHWDNNKLA
jgi:hypothetical protein